LRRHAGPLETTGALGAHAGSVPCSSVCHRCLTAALADRLDLASAPEAVRRSLGLAVVTLVLGLVVTAGAMPLPSLAAAALVASAPSVALPGVPHARADLTRVSAGPLTTLRPPTTRTSARPPESGVAYRLAAADGGVFNHGWYADTGSGAGVTRSPVVGIAQTAHGEGYWLASADGGVFSFGSAPFLGSLPGDGTRLREPIVAITATPDGKGYWLTARDGGVFTFGTARYYGSGVEVGSRSVAGMAVAPDGAGYWLVGTDGGVFSFGSARFYGSAVDAGVQAPMRGLVPTASGAGYWLVGADGGVFAFGDAPFLGSNTGQRVHGQIAGMAATTTSNGYWLVGTDGGVFSFGDAPHLGSPVHATLSAPVTAVAAGIGRRRPAPTTMALPDVSSVTVPAAAAPAPAAPAAPAVPAEVAVAAVAAALAGPDIGGRFGWDISYPQCGGPLPSGKFQYGIVGINGGRPYKHNPCLAEQWRWAQRSGAAGVYVNVSFPRSAPELSAGSTSARQPSCNGALACVAYNWGYNGVVDAMTYARSQGVDPPFVWLDVEVLNYWTSDLALNAVVIRGAIDGVRAHGKEPGIYSTPLQWGRIAGDEAPGLPVWSAGANGFESVGRYCTQRGFGGGPVAFVQLLPGQYDPNVACPGAGPSSRYFATK